MPVATCPSREELMDYVVGKLPDEASDTVASHLDACPDCQAKLATLPEPDDTLVARLRGPVLPDPFAEEPGCGQALVRAMAVMGRDRSATALPRQLGEYQLIERLGSGGMGTVYKARQGRLDRIVALKILLHGRTDDPRALVRFEREMKAIGQLDHANIVRAYDAREIDGTPVLIMEFVDGLDLAEIVGRDGPVAVSDACELVRQTALALQCAHDHGLVHRDVKPSNIMLARAGEVKLLDLGLARFYAEGGANLSAVTTGEEMTDTGQAMGTADFMAPEQASDSRTVDIRVDIYSLGCTLYKLLTGRAPFSGPAYCTALDKMNAHVHQPAPPVRQFAPDVPEGLARVLDRMLAKYPDDRFATPAAVVEVLAPWCVGADLRTLLRRAIEAKSSPLPPGKGRVEDRSAVRPAARPPLLLTSWGWKWFLGQLLLLMMAGGFGFALGITIRIKRDGQTTAVEVPGGSTARIGADGQVDVELPGRTKSAGVETLLRSFTTADLTISKDVSKADGSWLVKCEDRTITRPIRLFEVPEPSADDCTLIYRAKLKSEGFRGRAYLEMWCRFPGQGDFFSRDLNHVLSGSSDWSSYETPFFLKKGEKPDLIKLNLAVEGSGKIAIKDVELIKATFPAIEERVTEPGPAVPEPSTPSSWFRTAAVTRGDLMAVIEAAGTLEPAEVVDVGAQVDGSIVRLGNDPRGGTDPNYQGKPIDYNSPVDAGTVLAAIDPTLYKARRDEAAAGLDRAKADFAQAEARMTRVKLGVEEATPAEAAMIAARAAVAQGKAALDVAQANLDRTVIKSPVKGVVIDRRVNVGQNVAPASGAGSLFLIAKDIETLQVWASVNEADIGRITKGMDARFTVDAFPRDVFRGKITQIRLNATMTQNIVTYTVVVALDKPDRRLMPYMTASVKFEIATHRNVLRVPNAALRWMPTPEQMVSGVLQWTPNLEERNTRARLWVKTRDGRHVQPIEVDRGLTDGALTEVSGAEVKEGLEVVMGESVKLRSRDRSVCSQAI